MNELFGFLLGGKWGNIIWYIETDFFKSCFYASLWSVIYGVCCSPKRVQRLVLGTLTITMRCTFSGRLSNKQSYKCLLISNDGENGPSAPALASIQRFKISLATSPASVISLNLTNTLQFSLLIWPISMSSTSMDTAARLPAEAPETWTQLCSAVHRNGYDYTYNI